MSNNRASYFLNFSPNGCLQQTEFSMDAVKFGANIIGIKNNSGGFLFIEKCTESKIAEYQGCSKIDMFSKYSCCAISGLTADARFLFEKTLVFIQNNLFMFNCFVFIQNNLFMFNCLPGTEKCAKKIRDFISFSSFEDSKEFVSSRPFGVAFILMGRDLSGLSLFQVDPSGEYSSTEHCSLGGGSIESDFLIEEGHRKKMSFFDTKNFATKIFKSILKKEMEKSKIEFAFLENKKSKILLSFL